MNIRELARLARLSPSAISLALRDSPKVSAATKARVQALAQKNGYQVDARIGSIMSHLRRPAARRLTACFGAISFYPHPRPWEESIHMQRIYAGMQQRARELGYRVEPLWLRAPGMNLKRFRGILDTRGIEGLLCFGSPDFDQEFPAEFDRCAAVNIGLSIHTPLHRVISHAYDDTVAVLDRLHALGYRRPGLVLSRYEEVRNGHAHASAYLGWCERQVGLAAAAPILRLDAAEAGPLLTWLRTTDCDAVVFVHPHSTLAQLQAMLKKNRLRAPADFGLAVLSQNLEGTGFSGLQENQPVMGAWAVELLAARVAIRDFGLPSTPRIEMVASRWIEGNTLRVLPVNS